MSDMTDDVQFCSYAEFGEQFFRIAVTEDRILAALSGLSQQSFDFGPMGVGPGRLAKVSATGLVGSPDLVRVDGTHIGFRLAIPVDARFVVDLGIDQHRFQAALVVNLSLTARPALPLHVVIDVTPPTRDDVTVTMQSASVRASLLRLVAGIDDELRRFVAKYVARELDKPAMRAARQIDVGGRMGRAWRGSSDGVDVDLTRRSARAKTSDPAAG
jgi:hypothetical protein